MNVFSAILLRRIGLWTALCFSCVVLVNQQTAAGQETDNDQQAVASQPQSNDWIELFNGENLDGWTQKNGTAKYTVEPDGVICGTTNPGSPNSFLCTDRLFGNFELEFEVKVDDKLNSGVQIRSRTRVPRDADKKAARFGRVFGPQVEIESSGAKGAEAGYVYGEATGRGWLTPKKRLKPRKVFQDNQWNHYRIVAQGSVIKTWINGEPIEVLDDPQIFETHPRGFVGLQVHSIGAGQGPYQVRWKNLKLRELPNQLTHSFIGFGKANGIVVFDESGKAVWKKRLPASDGWKLESGNILAAIYPCKEYPKGGVVELDFETKNKVWDFQGRQKEVSTVQQIAENEYVLTELGPEPKAVVINRNGDVLRETALDCQKQNAHMQTRMLRRLDNGNFLAPHLFDFAVKEYDPETGKVLKVLATDDRGRDKRDWPFTAIRLENGHTVIGCTNGNRVIEFDSNGKIVWKVDNDDIGKALISDACGIQRLANGNTVITSYYAKADKVKLLEVTPDHQIVWTFANSPHSFHHFQILTTNGQPLKTKPLR